ncbi:MAG: acetyl-CoA carboxylase biotin carboxyl carrier protein subunit [Eubacterium sp.]|jgi:biotin carboxyl carrier protein|nr:acetyl-CoA carboxylase biotin carboxyl carrier protein subunit [Eubacterium sp.]
MKRYSITVNGNAYDVMVEEVLGQNTAQSRAMTPTSPTAPASTETGETKGDIRIVAPMNGTIIDVKVKPGANVENGTVIAVLEAMKMENDIVATGDGVVATIEVSKGTAVNTGAVIATIKTPTRQF